MKERKGKKKEEEKERRERKARYETNWKSEDRFQ